MNAITIDGLGEEDFRRSIESMLWHGQADAAASKLRMLLAPYAGEGEDKILPARFLTISAADVTLGGWDELAISIGQYDRPGQRISALSVTVSENDGSRPDEADRFKLSIKTDYFSDEAYPFSRAARCDLLDSYSHFESTWQGNSEGTDTALSVEGIEDLYGALAQLEARLLQSAEPNEQDILAGSLGACYLAVLVHQAVRAAVHVNGLPRPLCILTGSSQVYPYFDAPVVSCEECLDAGIVTPLSLGLSPSLAEAHEADEEEDEEGEDDEDNDEEELSDRANNYGSLLSVGATMRKKKPVMVLNAADAVAASQHYEVGAAHCLTVAGNSARVGVLPGLGAAAYGPAEKWEEAHFPGELADSNDGFDPEPDNLPDEPIGSDWPHLPIKAGAPAHCEPIDESVAPEAIDAAVEKPAEAFHFKIAGVPEDASGSGGAGQPEPSAELGMRDVVLPKPDCAPLGHRWRTKVAEHQQPHTMRADRITVFLRWTRGWLRRLWP